MPKPTPKPTPTLDLSAIKDPAIRAQMEALAGRDAEAATHLEAIEATGEKWPQFVLTPEGRRDVGLNVMVRNRFGMTKGGTVESVIKHGVYRVKLHDDLIVTAHEDEAGWYGLDS